MQDFVLWLPVPIPTQTEFKALGIATSTRRTYQTSLTVYLTFRQKYAIEPLSVSELAHTPLLNSA